MIDIGKSSFNSLVFTSGGMAPECNRANKRLAEKNSWKMQGAICICHDICTDKAQICPFEEHPCYSMRISRQTKSCPPLGPHWHWLQFNSLAHNSVKLRCGVNDTTPVISVRYVASLQSCDFQWNSTLELNTSLIYLLNTFSFSYT